MLIIFGINILLFVIGIFVMNLFNLNADLCAIVISVLCVVFSLLYAYLEDRSERESQEKKYHLIIPKTITKKDYDYYTAKIKEKNCSKNMGECAYCEYVDFCWRPRKIIEDER